jgi:hypothetical protein
VSKLRILVGKRGEIKVFNEGTKGYIKSKTKAKRVFRKYKLSTLSPAKSG